MKKILMILIEQGLEIKVLGLKNMMASNDNYIFTLDKIGSHWNVELQEFVSSNFGKKMTLTNVGIKDIIIFLTQKLVK